MPIYEYRCRKCGRKSEFITLRISEPVEAACRHCGSEAVERTPSRVRVRLSEETRMERLADPSRLGGLDENDPKSMARWMKKMSHEMGEDFDGDVDAMVEEAMEEEARGGSEGGESFGDDRL
jgi:putative FmdB family regulatory protein